MFQEKTEVLGALAQNCHYPHHDTPCRRLFRGGVSPDSNKSIIPCGGDPQPVPNTEQVPSLASLPGESQVLGKVLLHPFAHLPATQ